MTMRFLPATALAVFAAAPAVAQDWTGFYAGGQLGYGDLSDDLSGSGYLGGVHAGYMTDLGSFVLGGEVDYDAADLEIGGGPDSIDAVTRLKLRGGYDLGPSLIYATAGWAHANAEVGGADFSDDGWFGGVGMAYQVNDQWLVGGELLQHRFEDFDGTGLDIEATTVTLRASLQF
jgi:opacity protein-like surface antigen